MKSLWLTLLFVIPLSLGAQALITEPALKTLLAQDKTVVVLDVRELDEFQAGHLPMAKLLPYTTITAKSAAQFVPTKTTKVVVYCRSGRRSAIAAQTLKTLGYTNVVDFGAYTNWKGKLALGGPEKP